MARVVQQVVWGLGLAVAVVMVAVAVLCLANPHRAAFYLIDIFSVPLFTSFVAVTAVLGLLRQKWSGGFAVMACLLMGIALWPQMSPIQAAPAHEAKPVRLVFANLLIRNMEPERLLPWVEEQDADIVAVIEANGRAKSVLIEGLRKTRPHIATRYDMVVASRYPLRWIRPRPAGFALMTVDVDAPGRTFTLAVAHLTRPWPFSDPQDQPRQFARMSRSLGREMRQDFVLVGDFNTTPSASAMRDFMNDTGLHNAAGVRGTWPSFLPSLLRVSIDNALASPDLVLSHRQVGGFTGSDHRPVSVDIRQAR